MKQLILKELREQFKVALIGLALFSVMLALAFAGHGTSLQNAMWSQSVSESFQPLLRKEFLVQTSFFCGLFGTLLGWLQIWSEHHPDLWAFLVHRPIQRGKILQSKVVAGLLLYGVGAGLPLLGFVLLVSIPGQVAAPFTWPMALPLVAIFLVGMVHYLAGLLTGLRRARWFASRGFGVGLAVVGTAGLFEVPEFWHALLIVVATGTVLALAVWGSFQTGGIYRDQPVAGKVALTLASTASCLVLFALCFGVLVNLLSPRGHQTYTHTYHQLTRDGQVHRITQHGMDEADIADLNGQPVRDAKTGQLLVGVKNSATRYAFGLSATADAAARSRQTGRYRRSYSSPARFFSPWANVNKVLWYLTADGRLVGYHRITRRRVASLRPSEPAGDEAGQAARFLLPNVYGHPGFRNGVNGGVLASVRTAYRVDLEQGKLKPLLTLTNGDSILGFTDQMSVTPADNEGLALILSRTGIYFCDLEGVMKLALPYVPAASKYPSVAVVNLEATNTFAVRFDPPNFPEPPAGAKLPTHVKWVNGDGSVRKQMDLPMLPPVSWQHNSPDRFFFPLLPPAFPFWTWDEPARHWHLLRSIPALLCAGIAWRLGRRNHFSAKAQVAWAFHHLIFGLPGLLAFLAVQEWPAKEPCSHCHQPRAVDREQCDHCHADFAPSEKNGTEIFAPLTGN